MLEIALLSPLTIQLDGQPLKLPSRRTEALVVYLLRNPQPHAREVLAALLWDDLPQNKALSNLRVLLANLRKDLAPYVTITRQSAAWNGASDYRVDLTVLEELLAVSRSEIDRDGALTKATAATLGAALQRYQGDLLPVFYLHAGQGFEEWLATEREWLWTRAVEALDDLATEYLQWGDYRAGVEQAQRLVDLDPLREEGHQLLMQLWAADGQISAALAQYERCVQVLDQELGVPPHPFTTELYERMQRGDWRLPRPIAATVPVAGASPTPPIPHNLPRQMAPIWGRATELVQLATYLGDPTVPLITILGPGGIGKTRLAMEAARALIMAPRLPAGENDERLPFQDGVYLVALAPLREATAIAPAIAAVIGCRFQPNGGDESTQLLGYLRSRSLLLLLDNVEHLLDETEIFGAILAAAPQVQLLVTSRHKLNRTGETVLLLTGLDYPPAPMTPEPGDAPAVGERLLHYSAVRLFVEHVRRVHGNLSLGDADLPAVGQICRLAQGMPLAILLAAAWVEVLSPAEIAAEIEQNVTFWGVTTNQAQTAAPEEALPARQRTMHAIFEHSWQLLTRDEQGVFARLSIFRGGCTRPVAQQVTGGSLRELLSLAHKFLLVRDSASGRFTVHELLRQLAAAKLVALGQAAAPLHQLAVATMERLYAQNLTPYYGELADHAEQANLLAQARHYLQLAGDVACDSFQHRLAIDYYSRALAHTPSAEPRTRYQLLLQRQKRYHLLGAREEQNADLAALETLVTELADVAWQIEVLLARGYYANAISDHATVLAVVALAVELAQSINATEQEAVGLSLWGLTLARRTENRLAETKLVTALELFRQVDQREGQANVLNQLGLVRCDLGDYERGKAYYQQALVICRAIQDQFLEARVLNSLGLAANEQGNPTEAFTYFHTALPIRRAVGDRYGESITLSNLGVAAEAQGDYMVAQRSYQQALDLCLAIDDQWGVEVTLGNLGGIAQILGDYPAARTYYEQSLAICRTIAMRADESRMLSYLGLLHLHQQTVQPAYDYCQAAVDLARAAEAPDEEGIALTHLGHVLVAAGRLDTAREHYQLAIDLRRKLGQERLTLDPRAGVAQVCLHQGDQSEALCVVETLLHFLTNDSFAGADEPFRIYLTCYRVLQATGDQRATPLLVQAHQRLQQLAALITDEALRHSYLQTVPIHRELIAAFQLG